MLCFVAPCISRPLEMPSMSLGRRLFTELSGRALNKVDVLVLSPLIDAAGKILSMKKSISKTDKKKKKELAEQTDKMEQDLQKRHADELNALTAQLQNGKVNSNVSC